MGPLLSVTAGGGSASNNSRCRIRWHAPAGRGANAGWWHPLPPPRARATAAVSKIPGCVVTPPDAVIVDHDWPMPASACDKWMSRVDATRRTIHSTTHIIIQYVTQSG